MIKVLEKRFSELTTQISQIEDSIQIKDGFYGHHKSIEHEQLLNWAVKARSLISKACGKESEHYAYFIEGEKFKSLESYYDVFKRIKAIFLAAKEDFEGGYLISIRNLVQAEVADSELDQAKLLLNAGYIVAAAVVAGVVLETTLRTLCDRHKINYGKLDKMNADLAKAGEYNSLVQKRITAIAAIRNSAAHGKDHEFNQQDVKVMISEIENFVIDAFS